MTSRTPSQTKPGPPPARRSAAPRRQKDSATTWQRDINDLLDQGVLLHGADGRIEQANRAAAELLGDTDLVGQPGLEVWSVMLGPQGRPLRDVENPLRVTLATGLPTERVVGVRLPDAHGGTTVRWLTVRAVPLPLGASADDQHPEADPNPGSGAPAPRAVVVLLTAPEDEAAVAAARDRDHLLGLAQRMARLSVWRFDPGTGTVEWLDGDGRGMGTPGERTSQESYLSGIHPDDRPAHDAMLASLLSGAESAEVDLRYRWKDGWRHWHMWAESVVDVSGAVIGLWGTTQEVTDRFEAEAAARRGAMTDSLTQLANRTQAEDRLNDTLSHAGRQEGTGLLLIDVDRFNVVNERHGHTVGDALLVELGRRLTQVDLPGCTPARLGGDEFGLVLQRTTTAAATAIAHRLHAELTRPYLLPGTTEPVTLGMSLGVAVVSAAPGVTPSELFRQAGLAAAEAKASGGDRVVAFDDELRARTVTRHDMQERLRTALADSTVRPVYQPVISLGADAAHDRITSCEALARIWTPTGLVPPSEFVDVAEESGLIVDLDVAVFGHAMSQLLTVSLPTQLGVAVNLSPLSLQVPGLVGRITAALPQDPARRHQLRFEITEGSLAEPTPALVDNLRGLRAIGGQIGLDDFGTGYSALSYLRRFDLDFMKIDRSFVADVCRDRRSAAVVRAVIELAHAHDLSVVAEGIETADQLEALREMRCDMVQGYHLGRPMPLADLVTQVLRSDV